MEKMKTIMSGLLLLVSILSPASSWACQYKIWGTTDAEENAYVVNGNNKYNCLIDKDHSALGRHMVYDCSMTDTAHKGEDKTGSLSYYLTRYGMAEFFPHGSKRGELTCVYVHD